MSKPMKMTIIASEPMEGWMGFLRDLVEETADLPVTSAVMVMLTNEEVEGTHAVEAGYCADVYTKERAISVLQRSVIKKVVQLNLGDILDELDDEDEEETE